MLAVDEANRVSDSIAEVADTFRLLENTPDGDDAWHDLVTEWEREQFLRHVADGEPLRSTALEGAKDVQLTELCYQSDRERRWIDVPNLEGA